MANEKQSVFVHIGSEYYTFTAAEKKLADYILSAQDCISRMSISQLASACSVADATVSRFCRRLGYKGYPDFKIAIANSLETTVPAVAKTSPVAGSTTSPANFLPSIWENRESFLLNL